MKHTRSRTPLAVALGLALVAGLTAPVSAADKETRQMMADIRMLQEQSQQLQNLLGSVTETLKTLSSRIDRQADQQTELTRKSFADQKLTIDAVAGDLRVVRERMDDNNVRVGSLTQEVDALRQTVLQLNVSQPVTADPLDPAAGGLGGAPSAPPAVAALPGGLSPQKAFDQAMADFFGGQYELAVAGLEGYIRNFPKSEQADDAQVGIGYSHLQLGRNDKAVESFDLAIRTYPKGNAIPEAYYRKGVALQNLRQAEAARAAFETVVKNYPDSPEATLAKQALDKLAAPSPRKP